jgi:hypothetical protein
LPRTRFDPGGVRSNLIETLLRYADGSRPAEEDPITEVLAWLLDSDPAFIECFCELLVSAASATQGRLFHLQYPTIRTQVVVARVGGGTSRYDLQLDAGGMRAVVELKVWAGLTASAIADDSAEPSAPPRHQVDDYLALADRAPKGKEHLVFVLAPTFVDVGATAGGHRCWGGCLTWQSVHDAFARRLRAPGEPPIDAATKVIAEQFLGVMEVRRMATRMTLDGAVSVRRASRFRQSIAAALEGAWHELHADGTFEGFIKISRGAWQEGDQWTRAGYRLGASANDSNHFAFMGMYYGDDTLVEDVPDLCFFLHAKPDGQAGEALREQAADIAQIVAKLDARSALVRWHHDRSTWTPAWCSTSLAQIVLDRDPGAAITTHLRAAVGAARDAGLLAIYFNAIKRLG